MVWVSALRVGLDSGRTSMERRVVLRSVLLSVSLIWSYLMPMVFRARMTTGLYLPSIWALMKTFGTSMVRMLFLLLASLRLEK